MTVIKRNRNTTRADLISGIEKLCLLLEDQNESEAIEALQSAKSALDESEPSSPEQKKAVLAIIEAFEGEHELMAYTLQREGNQWTEVEELSQASSRVISLARRMR